MKRGTYRIVHNGLKQFPALNGLVQLLSTTWVPLNEDGVSK